MDSVVKSIQPADASLAPQVQAHLDDLTKPRGSLGRLEEIARQFCLASGTLAPRIAKKRIYCFAGDHGVAAEGVSAFPKAVTPQMVMNMLAGGAAINVLARHVGSELVVVDMGVDADLSAAPGLQHRKVRRGTDKIAQGPAMTLPEAVTAINHGIELATVARAEGVSLLGTGEMGIANTTPATALIATYLDCPVDLITGRGTGVDDQTLKHKIAVIKHAIEVNRTRLVDPLSILAALGGFEIAGICGLILGAASLHVPVVVDGYISSAGALAAVAMNPAVRDYLFFSHLSEERGHRVFVEKFGVQPVLDLRMRLGEGSGAALAMSIVEASVRIYNEMATFSSAGVSDKA